MKTRNPYSNTKKRKQALAFLAARGITQPRALYPVSAAVSASTKSVTSIKKQLQVIK